MAWDPLALQAELAQAAHEYTAALARERVTSAVGPVTVVLGLDGVLADVVIDPRALRRAPDELAELITEAITGAERDAVGRREVLADKMPFLRDPLLADARQLIIDPDAATLRRAGVTGRR